MSYSGSSDIYHYGVLGMKWGVRKNPQKTYQKSIVKLRKLSQKSENLKVKSAKKQYQADIQRDKSLRAFTNKGMMKHESKAHKLERQAHRYAFRSARAEQKAHKWVSKMNQTFEGIKISDISADDLSLGKRYALELMERKNN